MRNLKFLTATMASLALAGCAGSTVSNRSTYSVHQPVVQRTDYAIDLNTDGGNISAAEQARLGEWLDALQIGYGDRVAIDHGNGYPSNVAAKMVASVAADRGIILDAAAPVTGGEVASGMLRVVVTRSKASVPSCPDWSSSSDRNYNTANHSNYGCATNTNLAAMIADPEDLVSGRENKKLDNNSGKKAVDTYRAKTGGN